MKQEDAGSDDAADLAQRQSYEAPKIELEGDLTELVGFITVPPYPTSTPSTPP